MADPGEGPRAPPYFVVQTEARRAEKNFLETRPPPSYLKVWMTAPPPLHVSQGLDPPLHPADLLFVEAGIFNVVELVVSHIDLGVM